MTSNPPRDSPVPAPPGPSGLDLPPIDEVDRVLGLDAQDQEELPGLFTLNAQRVPLTRLGGMQVLLLFCGLHNLVRGVGPEWTTFLAFAAVVEAYAVVQLVVLRRYFARVRAVHLGTVFLVADLAIFALAVYMTGGPDSLVWPLLLARVADQMWIGRRRAAAMAAAAVGTYLLLLFFMGVVEGRDLSLATEAVKVAVLVGVAGYLVIISGLPWDLQGRTQEARRLILRLEAQSLALDRERRRAEEASQAKSQFLARMSHELRTPLNSVVGFTNILLKREGMVSDKGRNYLQRVRQNGLHLLALINDILDIARIEEGQLTLQPTPIEVEALVRDTVAQLEGRVEGSDLELRCSAAAGLPVITADEARLRQVLINLVGNAIKFTEEGWVEVAADLAPDGVPQIVVRDTGPGIPAARLPHIFEAFEQADGSTVRRYGGSGLGLAISQALCHAMGFHIHAHSVEGEGATFTVRLAPPEAGRTGQDADGPSPQVGNGPSR